MRLIFIHEESISPASFAYILHPPLAVHLIHYSPIADVRSAFRRQDLLQTAPGVDPHRPLANPGTIVVKGIQEGWLVALDDECNKWSAACHIFFINHTGSLGISDVSKVAGCPADKIIERYEQMVLKYNFRPGLTCRSGHAG